MGTRCVCIAELTVRSCHPPPFLRDWRSGSAARLHRVGRQFESVIPYQFLRDRLMVGRRTLNPSIGVRVPVSQPFFGQVGEWLNPIDCKSITPWVTLVRI